MDVARRLALRLYSLHANDRDWLLRQLESEPKAQLTALLDEIREIGLEVDPQLLALTDRSEESTAEACARIATVTASAACQVLRTEPSIVRRYLAHTERWPWLNELDKEQEMLVHGNTELSKQAQRLTPRARQALLRAFASRLPACGSPSSRSDSIKPSILNRLRRIARWQR